MRACSVKYINLLTCSIDLSILIGMSKQSLLKAVELAGGQAPLARAIAAHIPGSKISQPLVWGWINAAKFEVPPPEMVIPIAEVLDYRMTPHDLRPDIYPNPTDALPDHIAAELLARQQEAA